MNESGDDSAPTTARGRRTREALLAGARTVFESMPFERTKITDITAAAGVASGTFYNYFDSKEQVFREIAREVLEEMNRAPMRQPDDPTDTFGAVAASTRRYFLVCIRNASIARSIEQLTSADEGVASVRRDTVLNGVERSANWIRQLQRDDRCDPDVDAWATALALHTMTVRVAYDHLLHGSGDEVDRFVDAVAHIWTRSVGLRTPSSPFRPAQ